MSQYQVPYRQDRKDPAAGLVAVGGVAAVEVVVVGAVGAAGEVADDGAAAGAVVVAAAEQGMTQTWDWGWELGANWGKAGWVESRNPRQRRGTLQSALREHEGPGG